MDGLRRKRATMAQGLGHRFWVLDEFDGEGIEQSSRQNSAKDCRGLRSVVAPLKTKFFRT